MKVVIDSNVVYSGLYSKHGASYQILRLVRSERLVPAISVALFEEYMEVLGRPPLSVEFNATDRERFCDFLCSVAYLTEVFFLWRPFLRDPNDDMVLEAAVASGARLIITHNIKDFKRVQKFGIEAVTPNEYLQREV